jgi:deoxycytidylate deaminase/dephospho-CoA kinase
LLVSISPMTFDTIVIGFTGAFGSGCTEAAKHLRDERGFRYIALSDSLRSLWAKEHGSDEPKRLDLQKLGDKFRQEKGLGVLADLAMSECKDSDKRIVLDGIRNLGEISRLRDIFGYRFTLFSVLSSPDARWSRISTKYTDKGLKRDDFDDDDLRDRNEETNYGQQVELCLDKADILINNQDSVSLVDFKRKILDYADLVLGTKPRGATQPEILMSMAFSSSHSSKCLKRHVGALIVDSRGQVIGVGYNENPLGTKPCVEEPTYDYRCYRDILRNAHFEDLAKRGAKCPKCGQPLQHANGPPWRCESCLQKGEKTNLESFFFPDRAMSWCTAVHAEVAAILAAGERARGGTLYTTTFPCFQCAEKITQVGIKTVYFSEAYPDPHSGKRLELSGIELRQFEGVRSSSIERLFTRPS